MNSDIDSDLPPIKKIPMEIEERRVPRGRLCDVNYVAFFFGVSPQTVYRAHSEGRIKGVKTFSRLRFREEDVLGLTNGSIKRRRHRK